jgi:HEAT repeat protein
MGWFDRFKTTKGDPRVQELIGGLADPDPGVRAAAARSLGNLGASAAAAQTALEDAIADSDGEVCLAASEALSKIRKDSF